MKRYLIPILVSLALALGLVVSCGQANRPTPTIQTDTPVLGNSEVCALVYDYLENKISSVWAVPYRMNLLNVLDMARPYFQAVYQGNGKWQVQALGCAIDSRYKVTSYAYTGLWNFYEASGVIEPANDEASELLRYIQYWTR